jgi:hypothetical protein
MWSTFIFYRLEQTRCHAGASVPQTNFGSFGPKTTTSDLWNKTRTHFLGTGSTQNPVAKKGFITDFQSDGHFPATVFFFDRSTQHKILSLLSFLFANYFYIII